MTLEQIFISMKEAEQYGYSFWVTNNEAVLMDNLHDKIVHRFVSHIDTGCAAIEVHDWYVKNKSRLRNEEDMK